GSSPAPRPGSAVVPNEPAAARARSRLPPTQIRARRPRLLLLQQEPSAASPPVPLHPRLETDPPPPQPSARCPHGGRPCILNLRSPDHVRQQSEEARALDRLRELALLLRRHRGDAAWHDLAALGGVALQQPRVLVVDLGRIGTREWAGLAAAEERAACLCRCKAHGHYPSLAGASSLGGGVWRARDPSAEPPPAHLP